MTHLLDSLSNIFKFIIIEQPTYLLVVRETFDWAALYTRCVVNVFFCVGRLEYIIRGPQLFHVQYRRVIHDVGRHSGRKVAHRRRRAGKRRGHLRVVRRQR